MITNQLDISNLQELQEYGKLGYAIIGDMLTTARYDKSVEHADLWPEGNRYHNGHLLERYPLEIFYWKKTSDTVYELDREVDKVLINMKALLSSFGPSGMVDYLHRRYNYEYQSPYEVEWISDDPEAVYLAISNPSFKTLEEAAQYIHDEMAKTNNANAAYGTDVSVEGIMKNAGIRTMNNARADEQYPGGKYSIKHQRFHLEIDYPEKPKVLYTVDWVSDEANSRYGIVTQPTFKDFQEAYRYIQREATNDRRFAMADGSKGSIMFDREMITTVEKTREVVMRSVFTAEVIGKYVIRELKAKDVIGSWAYTII